MPGPRFRVLYSDIGGVLGTNGWDTGVRDRAATHFRVDPTEIQARHRLMFDSFERGFITFESYIRHVFFGSPRDFTFEQVRDFTFSQSVPWPENIAFFANIRRLNNLKLALISNEGEAITGYRVEKFGLRELADFLVVSHCVHSRKPDPEIWRLALDLAQVKAEECVYVDDREMFVTIAAELGFTAVQHTSLEDTKQRFLELGLAVE